MLTGARPGFDATVRLSTVSARLVFMASHPYRGVVFIANVFGGYGGCEIATRPNIILLCTTQVVVVRIMRTERGENIVQVGKAVEIGSCRNARGSSIARSATADDIIPA
jgi:hypothetical protein